MPNLTIVFDLDGTLVHTAPDLTYAVNLCIDELGAEPLPVTDIEMMIGNGMPKLIERALLASDINLPELELRMRIQRFFTLYEENLLRDSAPYPGAEKLLAELKSDGCHLAICTNKRQQPAEELLRRLDLEPFFDAIIGANDDRARKPKPEPLFQAVYDAGGEPANAMMVGDSKADAHCAEAAGLPCILVDYGYTTIPATELPAAAVVSHLDELPGVIKFLRQKRNLPAC